jgi:hypothetical protein
MSIFARRAFENIQDAGADFFLSAIKGFHDLRSVGQSALNALLNTFAQSLSKSFFEGIFPGFAQGGSFTVGGSGGTDSQLVAFRATPGEPVAVGDRFVNRSVGGTVINQTFNVQAGMPSQWEAQMGTMVRIAAGAAHEAVSRQLAGRR